MICCLCSCAKQKYKQECASPLGCLLFSQTKVEWGDVRLGEKNMRVLKVYNPTKHNVRVRINTKPLEFEVSKMDNDFLNLIKDDFVLPASCIDSICLVFSPKVLSLLGEYKEGIYLEVDNEISLFPLEMSATILENFDTLCQSLRLHAPVLDLEKDTFDFGVINGSDKVKVSFKLRNIGERDLIIRKIETGCNCTKIDILKRVISHGDSTILNLEYSPMGKSGKQYKHIRIFCNDPEKSVVIFIIKGYIDN